jgi:hypothetical protein
MLHELFKDFVFKFNIRNGELASQEKLNESVNVLKKETDDLYNRSEIIRGELAFPWTAQTYYKEGEIVSYQGKNWIVIPGQESINDLPTESYKWTETRRADWTMELDPYGYIHRNNTDPYLPVGDYNPAVKKYVDDADKINYIGLDLDNGINFIPIDYTSLTNVEHLTGNGLPETDPNYIPVYTPTSPAHAANKKYVDDQIVELAEGGSITVGNTLNSEALGLRPAEQYVTLERKFSGNYNGFAVKNGSAADSINATDWMRTTANGLLPYDDNAGSSLGSADWKFAEVHAKTIYADTLIAQEQILVQRNFNDKYESDMNYEPGTILRIGDMTEVSIFDDPATDIVAGIVAKELTTTEFQVDQKCFVTLKGAVMVKVDGIAHRGDFINAGPNGIGVISTVRNDLTVGVCISTNNVAGKCKVKV